MLLAAAAILLEAALALAQSNQTPIGALEGIDAGGIAHGWAIDPDTAAPIDVHLYLDGLAEASVRKKTRP